MRAVDRDSEWWEYADLKWQQHKETGGVTMRSVCVEFELDHYTKNTGKFVETAASGDDGEVLPEPAIKVLYVQQKVLARLGNPLTLSVQISAPELIPF